VKRSVTCVTSTDSTSKTKKGPSSLRRRNRGGSPNHSDLVLTQKETEFHSSLASSTEAIISSIFMPMVGSSATFHTVIPKINLQIEGKNSPFDLFKSLDW
jgi:hypothetical protein